MRRDQGAEDPTLKQGREGWKSNRLGRRASPEPQDPLRNAISLSSCPCAYLDSMSRARTSRQNAISSTMHLASVSAWQVPEGQGFSPAAPSLARGHRSHLPPAAFLISRQNRTVDLQSRHGCDSEQTAVLPHRPGNARPQKQLSSHRRP